MRAEVIDASRAVATDCDELWLFGGLTDYSYEESAKYPGFRRAITSYVDAGCGPEIEEQLRVGINGVLRARFAGMSQLSVRKSQRSRAKIPDLVIHREDGEECLLEVKFVFDCTKDKYFKRVADDWTKLSEYRRDGFEGQLFQLVYFLQFPNYVYGGKSRRIKVTPGIDAQYARVASTIPVTPVWPESPPAIHALNVPSLDVRATIKRRFEKLWHGKVFDVEKMITGAAVGLAIWEFR